MESDFFPQESGGGKGEAVPNAAFLYLGKWGPPAFGKLSDEGERIQVKSIAGSSAPPLSVQTLVIRIECNAALREAVLKQMDFAALRSLLPR